MSEEKKLIETNQNEIKTEIKVNSIQELSELLGMKSLFENTLKAMEQEKANFPNVEVDKEKASYEEIMKLSELNLNSEDVSNNDLAKEILLKYYNTYIVQDILETKGSGDSEIFNQFREIFWMEITHLKMFVEWLINDKKIKLIETKQGEDNEKK